MSKVIAGLGVVAGLGVAALPLSSYAAFDTAQITAEVGGAISIEVTGNKASVTPPSGVTIADNEVYLAPVNGGAIAEGAATVKVSGNAASGYTLSIKDSDSQTALVSADNHVIAAGVPDQGSSAWGYKSGTATGYTAITATDVTIKTTDTAIAEGGDSTDVTFGVSVSADQEAGTYKGGVIFTAVANN